MGKYPDKAKEMKAFFDKENAHLWNPYRGEPDPNTCLELYNYGGFQAPFQPKISYAQQCVTSIADEQFKTWKPELAECGSAFIQAMKATLNSASDKAGMQVNPIGLADEVRRV